MDLVYQASIEPGGGAQFECFVYKLQRTNATDSTFHRVSLKIILKKSRLRQAASPVKTNNLKQNKNKTKQTQLQYIT